MIKYVVSHWMTMMKIDVDHGDKRLKSKFIQVSRLHKSLAVDLRRINLLAKVFNYNS